MPAEPEMESGNNVIATNKTYENLLMYLMSQTSLPESVFRNLVRRIGPLRDRGKVYPKLYFIMRSAFLARRALRSVLGSEFYIVITGRYLYWLWKFNVLNGRRKFAKLMEKREKLMQLTEMKESRS
jgi:hypothetical protein